ncbi:DNA-directed RNA polymerase subunit beta [Bienertia sinuspersici]
MTEKEKEVSENVYNDPLFWSPNESTQMQLSPMLFDGNNFIPWSRSVKLALGAKNKIGFIDGKIEKPHYNSKDYLKSMKEDVANGFSLVELAKQLWDELN